MTREEAIKVLSESIHDGSKVPWDKIVEAVHLSIEALSQPSLPSNLDEAAEESARAWRKNPDGSELREIFFQPHIRGFKAGAEWMAGQGQTFEAHVDNGCAIASGVKLPFVLWDTYEDGDVLKVQIRKKQ